MYKYLYALYVLVCLYALYVLGGFTMALSLFFLSGFLLFIHLLYKHDKAENLRRENLRARHNDIKLRLENRRKFERDARVKSAIDWHD